MKTIHVLKAALTLLATLQVAAASQPAAPGSQPVSSPVRSGATSRARLHQPVLRTAAYQRAGTASPRGPVTTSTLYRGSGRSHPPAVQTASNSFVVAPRGTAQHRQPVRTAQGASSGQQCRCVEQYGFCPCDNCQCGQCQRQVRHQAGCNCATCQRGETCNCGQPGGQCRCSRRSASAPAVTVAAVGTRFRY